MSFKLGLIGFPIKHSLSPWIHSQFLEKSGLEGEYTIFEIDPKGSFEQEITYLRNSQMLDGFNVTVPYKQQIIPYLDDLDANARAIGAVNTVVSKNGTWIGYNTDGTGYVTALKHDYPQAFEDKNKRILIIGAGGAARGIYYALITERFAQIDIANRTPASADAIAELSQKHTNTAILTLEEAERAAGHYDMIIQTTNVGMKPDTTNRIMSLAHLNQNSVVSDIIYQPHDTSFLTEARHKGASVHYGYTMLLHQAQYAFELWTGQRVPVDELDQPLKTLLEKGR